MSIIRTLIAASLGIVAAGGAAMESAGAATEWIMASGYPESNYFTRNLRQFIEEVRTASKGELKINLNSNDTLIKLDGIKRAVQTNQIPIGEIRLGVYGNEDPMYILDGLPFIAPTYETAWKLKEAQKPYFDELFAKNGMRIVYYTPWPGQGFYTKAAVNSPDDFKGKKLRIYSTATQQMGQMLGFVATILPFAEIPQAFSTGLIDSLFTSPQTGIDIQAWDNTKYFMMAGAIYSKNAVIVNERAWRQVSPEIQKIIIEAGATAEKRGWEMSAEAEKSQMTTLQEKGMTVYAAPAPVVEKMKDVGQAMMVDWKKQASPPAVAALDKFLAQ